MKELSKKEAIRRVNDLGEILEACYIAAGHIVQASFDNELQTGWMGDGGIKQLTHYINHVEMTVKNLGRSRARTLLARELFIAVIRGDLAIQDIEEGSDERCKENENNG